MNNAYIKIKPHISYIIRQQKSCMNYTKAHIVFILFFLTSVVFSTLLMFHTFSYDQKNRSMEIAVKCWSDFGAHIPLIRSFSHGGNFDRMLNFEMPEYPIFPGEPIRYHYLFYMVVGFLEKIGIRIDYALNIPSIVGFAGLLSLIGILAYKLFRSYPVAFLSVLFFLFNGSASFLKFFEKNPLSFHSLRDIMTNTAFPSFGPWDSGLVSAFWNLNIYTNQRHLAAGFFLGLSIIALCLFLEKKHWRDQVPYLFISVPILSLLPSSHQPMLIILGLCMMWYIVCFPKLRIFLILSGIFSIGAIIVQLISYSGNSSSFSWYPGYLIHTSLTPLSFIVYWFYNLGFHLILIPIGFILAPIRAKKIILPVFILFLVANLFRFSVEIAANHKFFNFCMIFGNMLSAYALVYAWRKLKKMRVPIFALYTIFILLIFSMTLSGIIDFFAVVNDRSMPIVDMPKNEIASWIAHNTPNDAIILNTSYLYNPASIAGRSIFLGWPYFPWSAGYNENRMPIMDDMYASKNPDVFCPLFQKYSISYITVEEINNDHNLPDIDPRYFLSLGKPLFTARDDTYMIFDTKTICPFP